MKKAFSYGWQHIVNLRPYHKRDVDNKSFAGSDSKIKWVCSEMSDSETEAEREIGKAGISRPSDNTRSKTN